MADAVKSRRASTPSDGTLATDVTERRPGVTDEVVYARLVPVLERLLAAGDANVQRSALMALARIGDDPRENDEMLGLLVEHLKSSNQGVAEMAVVSLGVLGTRPAILSLTDVVRDSRAGRKLFDESRIAIRSRALAAYALGVAGSRLKDPTVSQFIVHTLAQVLERDGERHEDLQAACVLALGMVRIERGAHDDSSTSPSTSLQGQIEHLTGLLNNKRSPSMVRIHAPTALARLAESGAESTRERVAATLLRHLRNQREDRAVTRSLVSALGFIGDCDADSFDVKIRAALQQAVRERDHFTRSFAVMALADVTRRAGNASAAPFAASVETQEFLTQQLSRASTRLRPWIVTALGLIGDGERDRGAELIAGTSKALLHMLETTRSPDEASALSLAVGLARLDGAEAALVRNLNKINDERYRGDVALGLGVMGSLTSLDALREIKAETDHQPWLKEQVSIARAMLADKGLVTELVADMDECGCISSMFGNTSALAWVGDLGALNALLERLENEETGDFETALVVRALGRIADKDELPWESVLARGVNYASAPPTLTAPSGELGILDL